mgnify:CR=1 FL=1
MLRSLLWQKALESTQAQDQLHQLQVDTLRLFTTVASIGYLLWYLTFSIFIWPQDLILRTFGIVPVVVPVLLGTYLLLPKSRRAAAATFIGGGLMAVSWAIYLVGSAKAVPLYALLALAAAFVVHPLAGFLVTAASVAALMALHTLSPDLVGWGDISLAAAFSALAVTGVWSVMHHLFLALNWYSHSYVEAEQRMREAQKHRGQLAQAWKQLETAYSRLERANAATELAWRAAEVAERSKLELAANISHELRTPLNMIIGYSEMMMTSPGSYGGAVLPSTYRGDVNAIYRSAQHLLALTEDVLDLARMEVGKLGLFREPVDLGSIVEEAVALVRDYVEAKGLDLRLELPSGLPPVVADRLRIRQVVLNLLTNAARLTERGFISIAISRGEGCLRVSVEDTGPGIAAEDLPRVFGPFVARGRPSADGLGGAGLGLPISKRFIEMHGGDMGVESVAGMGATFWFTLPITACESVRAFPVRASPTLLAFHQPEPILVLASSDARTARCLQRHLNGYRVDVADSYLEAKKRAVELRAVAIVADLQEDGDADGQPVPVVRCPIARAGSLAEGLGVDSYLVKPISREALQKAIRDLGRPIERVLIADDDTRFVRFLSRLLKSNGSSYLIDSAHNGEEALEKMLAAPPDLLLLDLAMPGLDGIGVLDRMRAEPRLAEVKVIVISAYGEAEGAVPLGTEFRVTKPEGFRLAELTQMMAATLSQMAPSRAYLAPSEPARPAGRPG